MTWAEVQEKLLETNGDGDYLEPLIGPTEAAVAFDWSDWHIVLLPDGTWKAEALSQDEKLATIVQVYHRCP